jgi:hypothetical protein
MSEDFNWDDYQNTGDWITFENIGDHVVGTVKAVRRGKDFNGNPCPELIIDADGEGEKTLTAGQVMLKSALAEEKPRPGDRILIKYSGVGDAKPGKAPAKLFDVTVKRGGAEVGVPAGGVDPADLL